MEDVRKRRVKWEVLHKSSPALLTFSSSYARLSSILQKSQSRSSRKPLSKYNTTPTQTTILAHPKYSDKSELRLDTISSGDDKREHFTEQFANDFVTASMIALEFYTPSTIPWLNSELDFSLSPG